MTIFFTADLHFNHTNIIKHCNRPFSCVKEMNETLIKNYNSVVKPCDTTYILGDFAMKGDYENLVFLMNRLNGKKEFITGNHDREKYFLQMVNEGIIKSSNQVVGASINGQYIWMSHYAHRIWDRSHRGSWMVYGHSHGTLPPTGLSWDVGVDNNNYFPISFEQLSVIMQNQKDKYNALMWGVYQ